MPEPNGPSNHRPTRPLLWIIVFVIVVLIGLALWVVFSRIGVDDGDDEDIERLSREKAVRLIEMKNLALGRLENAEFDESLGRFSELMETLPDEPLGPRNLLVGYVFALDPQTDTGIRDPGRREQGFAAAETAAERLKKLEPGSAAVYVLIGKLAGLSNDAESAVEAFSQASQLAPSDPAVWYELSQAADSLQGAEAEQTAREALERAYELRPNNLIIMVDWLLEQVEAQSPAIVETLSQARETLRPFVESLKMQANYDVLKELDEAQQAAKSGNWTVVRTKVFILKNVLNSEIATLLDRKRAIRHPLEYVREEFSPEFYDRADLAERARPEGIAVKLSRVPEARQIPAGEKIRSVYLADFDLDGGLDVIVLREGVLEIYGRPGDADEWTLLASTKVPAGMRGLVVGDLDRDNPETTAVEKGGGPKPGDEKAARIGDPRFPGCVDADVDLIVFGDDGVLILRNELDPASEKRSLETVAQESRLGESNDVLAAALADLDHDGDLDLVVSAKAGLSLWSNRDNATFEEITARSALPPEGFHPTTIVPVDWNRNLSTDLLLAGPASETIGYLENLHHARFRWQPLGRDFRVLGNSSALELLDVDGNASWDLVGAGKSGVVLVETRTPAPGTVVFARSQIISETPTSGLRAWDYDNDGFRDILAWNENAIAVYRGGPGGEFRAAEDLFEQQPERIEAAHVGDFDGDGDQDLLVAGPDRAAWHSNEGGNKNHWIVVAVRADPQRAPQRRADRVSTHGVGSLLELKAGRLYQPRVVTDQTTHFGLGEHTTPEVVRVLWTNGIPQNVMKPEVDAAICAQQDLKGSCPYLYAWNGSRFEFVTDLLWASPIGLQLAEGVLAPAREWEYLKIPGEMLVPKRGEYVLQFTEELWEAAYFDQVKLIAVDHPADVEIYSNEKVGPAEIAEFKIHTVRTPRTPVAARDSRGRDVLATITRRDDDYLKAFARHRKQGLVDEHYVELDLGQLKDPQRITLFLTGWTFPTDTSINVSISQNPDVDPPRPPSLWVPGKPFSRDRSERSLRSRLNSPTSWKQVVPFMGFPGGKTKTIAVDLSDVFPTDDYRLRIATSMEIYWDHMFFTVDEAPAEYRLTEMKVAEADLHYRGFSKRSEHPGYGPERYDYHDVSTDPKWPPMHGRFTRYGDVTELLHETDARMAVFGSGDEMTVRFKVPDDGPPPGWKRDFILYNVGWDKDADLNTVYGQTVEPLPFAGMKRYPYPLGIDFPDTPGHREYLRRYQTRWQDPLAFWRQIQSFGEFRFDRVDSPPTDHER